MKYRLIEHRTKKFTAKYLQSIYVLTNGIHEEKYGCVLNGEIGIAIVLNGEGEIDVGGKWERQPKISVYGLVKQVQFHKMSPNYYEVNIGFNPHYLQLFLKDNISGLFERSATDLYFLLKKNGVDKLYDHLSKCTTDEDIHTTIEEFLKTHLLYEEVDKRILAAHDLICHKNIFNVEDLSKTLNISSAGLRNLFREKVGITPKELMKIQRIKKSIGIQNLNDESLTQLAYRLGYFDQAHFIHDFKEAIGLLPKQYFANQQLTFDFYNYGRWSYDSFTALKHIIK